MAMLEINFEDLTPEAQRRYLRFNGAQSADELNATICPIAVLENGVEENDEAGAVTIVKTMPVTCPYCGDDDVEMYEDEFYLDFAWRECTCNGCTASWRERYKVEYAGYEYFGKFYNERGEEDYEV